MRRNSFPVVQLDESGALPSLRFQRWAKGFGIRRLGRSLERNRSRIQEWLSGTSPVPCSAARIIIALSTIEPYSDGPLSYEDIFGRVLVVNIDTRTPEKAEAWL
jgi:hypothetical protein